MNGLGPFPMHVVIVGLALFAAWLATRFMTGRVKEQPTAAASSLVLNAAVVGLIAARVGYIMLWWAEYVVAPWSMLAIGDGGFAWWAGLPAAVLFVSWRTRRRHVLRRPVLVGIAAGMLVWAAASTVPDLLRQSAPPLPDITLADLEGAPVQLGEYRGRPVVVNLWASWCPPCRAEMPVIAHAQAAFPDVSFVLVNQGEDVQTIRRFLEHEGLNLSDVLLDPSSRTMEAVGTRGLPTTLFFDAEGRLVDSHMGELTRASLGDTLRRRFGVTAPVQNQTKE